MYESGTRYQNTDDVFSSMVRFGTVVNIDNEKLIARVMYSDLKDSSGQPLVSDWLPVLANYDITSIPWMPLINEQVLVLYEPIRNGRGVILGGVHPWQ